MTALWIVLGVVVLVLVWFFGTYNGLIQARNHSDESWSDIDTELKRRHDLIPNLVEVVKGYAGHEKAVFDRVIEARNAAVASMGSPASLAREESKVVKGLDRLFALAEDYPDLKASENFRELQSELSVTEDRIQRARRFYNANVRDLNNRIEMVPSNIVAGLFGFKSKDFFELDDVSERRAPRVEV